MRRWILIHSPRERLPAMSTWGRLQTWLTVHEAMGLAGASAVVIHSGYRVGDPDAARVGSCPGGGAKENDRGGGGVGIGGGGSEKQNDRDGYLSQGSEALSWPLTNGGPCVRAFTERGPG